MIKIIGKIGKSFNNSIVFLLEIFGIIGLFFNKFYLIFKFKFRYFSIFLQSFLEFVYYIGIRTLYVTSIISFLVGIFFTIQFADYININNIAFFAKMITIILIREIGPIVSGIILILRAQSFIGIRLSLMQNFGELEVLKTLGINPIVSILIPLILAFMVSLTGIILYFDFLTIFTSFLVLELLNAKITFVEFFESILDQITMLEIAATISKALLGGVIFGVINIYFSQKATDKLSFISSSVANTLTQSFIIFIILNFIISLMVY